MNIWKGEWKKKEMKIAGGTDGGRGGRRRGWKCDRKLSGKVEEDNMGRGRENGS